MEDNKKIIISVELKDDGTFQIKQLKESLDQAAQSQKNLSTAKAGTEKAILDEIKALKAERAATATTSKAYQEYSIKITEVEAQLRELTSARKADVQVNADFISNQGLASNTITEFGRLISDLPFGIIAVTNNISQLGSNFGNLSRKTGDASTSFKILLKQLKKGGALILAFQVLIALVTAYGDKILDFIKGNDEAAKSARELAEALEDTEKELRAEEQRLLSLITVLDDSTASREAQLYAVDELAKILPDLNEEEIANKDNIEATRLAIEDYIEQQLIRAEIDALVAQNAEKFRLQNLIEGVDRSDPKQVKKFLDENVSAFKRFFSGTVLGFGPLLEQQRLNLFDKIAAETSAITESAIADLTELQKTATRDRKKTRTTERIERRKTVKEVNLVRKVEEEADTNSLQRMLDGRLAVAAVMQQMHEDEMNRIQEQMRKRIELASIIATQVGKIAQVQKQALDAQIKRLDTERDVILNNDNLTASEKERLLKKNDSETRKVRKKQIRFERDMFQIEAAMELAKITLQLKGAMTKTVSDGVGSVAAATMSLGEFLKQLGPLGIAAYAASIGGVIATIVSARRKAQEQIQALSGESLGISGGGTSSTTVAAPAFNVVGATQTSQLAQTIAGAEDKPIKAFVVASDVTTAQELERSTIEGASIG
jgi:hypothetical protein|tara:strand:- start:851 stop:2830 length:1980 start_codon:yes stop_codon:yes gene_type:complete